MTAAQNNEMLGTAVEGPQVPSVSDMLGRPHSATMSLAANAPVLDKPSTPEERFQTLCDMGRAYMSEEELDQLQRAFAFANEAHKGQCRKSGEPFVLHPVEVAIILADLRMDADTLTAALLHDTVEDTETTIEDVESMFNAQVAQLVEGVTKITQIEVESLSDEQAATIRKMFVAMSKDIRVLVIKLADRLHNMRTLGAL